MGWHPVNLAVRFLLELAVLAALGLWGWQQGQNWERFALAVGVPLLAAMLWGTFRVPNDPGPARVAVPGIARLALELAVFGSAVWALADLGATTLSWIVGIVVAIHYAVSYDRIKWLLQH